MKLIVICQHCEKQFFAIEGPEGYGSILIIDFKEQAITFQCPDCLKDNFLHFGDINKYLEKQTRLPRIKRM